jgi:hypothetical protein
LLGTLKDKLGLLLLGATGYQECNKEENKEARYETHFQKECKEIFITTCILFC